MDQNYAELLSMLEKEHAAHQFKEFSSETALSIGLALVERAKTEKKVITIDIRRHGHQLFHYSFDGTRPDNDEWVKRKNRTVDRFSRSSYYMGTYLKYHELTLEGKYHVDESEYAVHGGAFPIIIRNTGVIGTITVSGMTQEEDHRWVVDAVEAYISEQS